MSPEPILWALKFLWYFWTTLLLVPLWPFRWARELSARQWDKLLDLDEAA